MYTENDDVPNGIANGMLCHLVKVVSFMSSPGCANEFQERVWLQK
jgi:hypothetical protein